MEKKDVIIIGGGAGGLTCASVLSQLGLKTLLIERNDKLGGDCLHYGCVPSKALLNQAKIAHVLAENGALTTLEEQNTFFNKAMQEVRNTIETIQQHDDPKRFEGYGCEVLFGEAKFISNKTIEISGRKIYGKRIVIATGSSPVAPPIKGLNEVDYLTNETIFNLTQRPQKLIIIGAGVIGIEMAQAFARLGTQVHVIDITAEILATLDNEIDCELRQVLEHENIQFHLKADIHSVSQHDSQYQVDLTTNKKQFVLQADQLLVATGRKPNCDSLDLEKTAVDFQKQGINVDSRLRTSNKDIYAVGDVINCPYKFTHLAEYHAGIVIGQIAFKFPQKTSYHALPSVVYTQPECALVGNTTQTDDIEVSRFSMKEVDRAITDKHTAGFCKLYSKKGKIVGAIIVGENAGEAIAEMTLAINNQMTVDKLAKTIHSYPTIAQINKRVAGAYYTSRLFNKKTKFIVKCLNLLSR